MLSVQYIPTSWPEQRLTVHPADVAAGLFGRGGIAHNKVHPSFSLNLQTCLVLNWLAVRWTVWISRASALSFILDNYIDIF